MAVDTAEGTFAHQGRDCPLARRWPLTDQSGRGNRAGYNRRDSARCTSEHRSLYLRQGGALCLEERLKSMRRPPNQTPMTRTLASDYLALADRDR
jgi:hypothetical protein